MTSDLLITTITVPTCNRPGALARLLDSLVRNLRDYGRSPRLVIADDSLEPDVQAANRARLAALTDAYPQFDCAYAGLAEKRVFAQRLAGHSGIDPGLIAFALFNPEGLSPAAGANHNALLLQTAGEAFLNLDDDIVGRLSPSPGVREGLALSADHDPTRVHLFPDRDALLEQCPSESRDLLGLHEAALGKSAGALARRESGTAPATDHAPGVADGTASVTLSWMGTYGDCGSESPGYYLWKDAHVRAQLTASEESYARLAPSREIFRAPDRLTIGNSGYCQSAALACDHRRPLPPFMPVERGADLIFGKTFAAAFPEGRIAYLPWGLLHAPVEPRQAQAADIAPAARPTRLNQILPLLIDSHAPGAEPGLEKLGTHLHDLGMLALPAFEEILHARLRALLTAQIDYLHEQLYDVPGGPANWADDIRAVIQILTDKLDPATLRRSILMRDNACASPAERLARVQRLTQRFGELLIAWPALFEAACDLKSRGITIARRVRLPPVFAHP